MMYSIFRKCKFKILISMFGSGQGKNRKTTNTKLCDDNELILENDPFNVEISAATVSFQALCTFEHFPVG